MLDGGRIVGGIFVVLSLAAGPAWVASVRASTPGAPRQAARGGPCVADSATMLRIHPQVLADWRSQAVRDGVRHQRSTDGRALHASLTGTCLGCHGAAAGFCNRCHADVGVSLNCWSCHKDSPSDSSSPSGGRRFAEVSGKPMRDPSSGSAASIP